MKFDVLVIYNSGTSTQTPLIVILTKPLPVTESVNSCKILFVIRSFRDKNTRRFFEGYPVRKFQGFAVQATRRLTLLDNAKTLADLRALRSHRLEVLRGDRFGQYSIRINRQWRVCFRWTEEGPSDVEIVDYH